MSDLIQVRTLIVANLNTTPEVKEAVLNLIDAIDSSIDEAGGFTDEDDIKLRVSELDRAIIGAAEDDEIVASGANAQNNNQDDEDEDQFEGLNDDENGDSVGGN